MLSVYDDARHIDGALAAGAVAYVIKTAHPDDLRSAIRQAFAHSVYLPGSRPAAAQAARVATEDLPDLTRRELEILQLVAEGHSNTQLAKMLWVTEQTVKFHLSNVYRKLDVANRTEASRWAQLHGLLTSPQKSDQLARASDRIGRHVPLPRAPTARGGAIAASRAPRRRRGTPIPRPGRSASRSAPGGG